ncbi:MAG: DUF3791 domain-containing protein [Eubacteriales bacterium]
MNAREMEFTVFCIENVATKLDITGNEAYLRLAVYSNILDEYIVPHYDVLHTQGKDYIVEDIVDYMKECGVA